MNLAENAVVKPGLGSSALTWPHRVLAIDRDRDLVILIKLAGELKPNGKKKSHVDGPVALGLHDLENEIQCGQLALTALKPPAHWSMTDEDYLEATKDDKEKERRKKRLEDRNRAWKLIKPIFGKRLIREIALNPRKSRTRILAQAKNNSVNATTVYRTLHLYLASGGVMNSLIPSTAQCGGPGKPKVRKNKLGRKSRVETAYPAYQPYILSEDDKQKIATGFLLARKGTTQEEAYLLTCAAYWSTLTDTGNGVVKVDLVPPNERPTLTEFKYWGRKLKTVADRKKRLGMDRWQKEKRVAAGSTQDQVVAVGQMAMIDATSTDVYMTSMLSRQIKLPPMNRTVVKEIKSTAVIGFYVGWEHPSATTALLAILSSAESKVAICKRFGIDITDEDWPFFLCKNFLADNGEMKSKRIFETELHLRISIEFAKARDGQSKSNVENQHHSDHKRLDHKLEGNTAGKQRERGEEHPALTALWNYWEYMHEYIQMVIVYNNEEVPHLAPSAMKKEGIKPTRINILKWMMARNMRADVQYDLDVLRSFTLPSKPAVMTNTGIFLLMEDGIRRLPGHRFYDPILQNTPAFKKALERDGSVPIMVKCTEVDLSHVWFASDEGPVKVPNVEADDDLKREGTLVDWTTWIESEDLRKDLQKGVHDQNNLDSMLRRRAFENRAKQQLAEEIAHMPKKPSKESVTDNLRRNRADEIARLKAQDASSKDLDASDSRASSDDQECTIDDAAATAMDAYMRKLS
jgi:hypothetical protein